MEQIEHVYLARFDAKERSKKMALWRVLCERFLQRFVGKNDRVLDLGAGYCEFINNIQCGARYAVDLNPDTVRCAEPGVTVYQAASDDMHMVPDGAVDVVFCSNFFEHLPSTDALMDTLAEVRRVLRGGGTLLVIQPNIKYAFREYWDFVDHHLPLSHLTIVEALTSVGFEIDVAIPRFLPYTTKSRLPQTPRLLRLYIALPLLWRIVGKQMFVAAHVARRP